MFSRKPIQKFRRKTGPHSLFKESYLEEAYKMALLGFTEKMMADWWGVKENTLTFWKQKYPKFQEVLRKGRVVADSEVAKSLYMNAITRREVVEEVHTRVIKEYDEKGKVLKEITEPVLMKVEKEVKGDVAAQKMWLSIRQRALWSEAPVKQDVTINMLNLIQAAQEAGYDLAKYSTEELLVLEKLGYKSLVDAKSN